MSVNIFIHDAEKGFSFSEDISALHGRDSQSTVWVDLETRDPVLMNVLAAEFGLHELTVEDCLMPGHFPKFEDFGNYVLLLLRGLKPDLHLENGEEHAESDEPEPAGEESAGRTLTYKIVIIVGEKFIITFRRQDVSWLDAIVRQIKSDSSQFVSQGIWPLVYRTVDVLTDRFLRTLGAFDRVVDKLEDELVDRPDDFQMSNVIQVKRKLAALRQMVRDQHAIVAKLANDPSVVRSMQLRRYFKDVNDHTTEIINVLDKQIDDVTSLREAHLAIVNVQLSNTMRVLTVLTTIAALLNIIVGMYGMNFEHMPLLRHQNGFWVIVAVMILMVLLMLGYFRRRRWI